MVPRRKPSPAMVVAILALIAALGGSAFAAGYVITRSSQIKDGAVTGSDVRNSSLTGRDVKNRSLTPSDFTGSVRGSQGPQGPRGPQGEVGRPGPTASAYVVYRPKLPIAIDFPGTTVMNLNSGSDPGGFGVGSGPLAVGVDSRVIANAAFEVTGDTDVLCTLRVTGQGTDTNTTMETHPAGTTSGAPIPVSFGLDVGPGTYDLSGSCMTASSGSHGLFLHGSITAIATAR
jgi:hypothetical protein